MIRLRREAPAHRPAREALLDLCFGPERFAKTCELLRRDSRPAPGLSFAALEDRMLIGTLRLWPITAGSAGTALLLGPLGVTGSRRGRGIGHCLVTMAIEEAIRRGYRAILLVGDAPYYARFGFDAGFTSGLDLPGPVDRGRFLGLELEPGALAGARGLVVPRLPPRRLSRPMDLPAVAVPSGDRPESMVAAAA
ncbi:MAG: GNAT family N-acetyltransferase [Alphaproteobacteria bacterium]